MLVYRFSHCFVSMVADTVWQLVMAASATGALATNVL